MASPALDKPYRWPLKCPLVTRSGVVPVTLDSRLVNGYTEFDPNINNFWLYKRFGLSPAPFVPTANVGFAGGIYFDVVSGVAFYVTGTNLNTTARPGFPVGHIGFLATIASGTYSFETVASSPPLIVLQNGTNAYTINTSTFAVTPIAGGYPPVTVSGWAYLDGTLYVMDPQGNIFGSNILDPTTWNGLNVIQASSYPDSGIALARTLNYVVAFKQNSTQIFYDNGNPTGSPLSPVPDAQLPLGCCSPSSVQSIDNILIWATSNNTASPQIAMLENLTPSIISTPAVERILDNFSLFITLSTGFQTVVGFPQSWSWVIKHAGHRFYGITSAFALGNITLVYDIDQKEWFIWTDPLGNYWPIYQMSYGKATVGPGVAQHLAQHYSNGNLYTIDTCYVYPNDIGVLFPVDAYTANFDADVDRKKQLNMMRFNADQVAGSVLNVRWSADDYKKWSNFRNVDLSKQRPILPNCGTFRRRAYHFRHLCNTGMRIRSVDLQMDVGML